MNRRFAAAGVFAAALIAGCAVEPETAVEKRGWNRWTIDGTSSGADGVRLADVNADGLVDITTAWEEGGEIRVYLHPGPDRAREPWPRVTVGRVASPEDAVFVDLDGDGALDVVSAAEGETRSLFIHWAPADPARLSDPTAWTTAPLTASTGRSQWMFTLPLARDDGGVDLIAGSKNEGAVVERFPAPADPRDPAAWRPQKLYDAGWIMSLRAHDMDGDGDQDVVASDRKGPRRGVLWLENPGPGRRDETWIAHRVGAVDRYEAMFLTLADLDADGLDDIVVATRGGPILFHRRLPGEAIAWETFEIAAPDWAGTGKAVAAGDLDGDGRLDLVSTCENAVDGRHGVVALAYRRAPTEPVWEARSISGPEGVKFDRVELLDLDGDGDLDVLTCEERADLGVIWYENPARAPQGH